MRLRGTFFGICCFDRRGLAFKFIFLIAAVLIVVETIVAVSTVRSQDALMNKFLVDEITLLGKYVALTSPEAILSFDYVQLEKYMQEVTHQKDMVYAVMLDEQGRNMTSYLDLDNPFIKKARSAGTGKNINNILQYLEKIPQIIHQRFPITYQGKKKAELFLGISKLRVMEEIKQLLLIQVGVAIGLILFLSASIFLIFRYSALRPIQHLMQGAERIKQGKLEEEVKVFSQDELGQLAIQFNEMMSRLKTTILDKDLALEQLTYLNRTLDEKVRQRSRELEISEQRIRAVLEYMGEGLIIINTQGLIESFNPAALQIFKANKTEVENQPFDNFLVEDATQSDRLAILDSLNRTQEMQGKRCNGSVFPMEVVITIMASEDHRKYVCIVRDITEHKQNEQRVRQVQQLLVESAHRSGMAEMATGVLHNIGNLLNSVSLAGEEISRVARESKVAGLVKANTLLSANLANLNEFLTSDDKGKLLPQYYIKLGEVLEGEFHQIAAEVKSLNSKILMMKEVIATQQAYAKAPFYSETVDVDQIIEDALKVEEASMEKWGITVKRRYAPIPRCVVQRSKLLQVLTNLIKNAKEAMANNDLLNKTKELLIETGYLQGTSIFIAVTDNGEGIDEANLTKIFNHGFTTKDNGHGFGLHTSANAMTEMGGSLSVKSRGKNEGACFQIVLPIAKANSTKAEENHSSTLQITGGIASGL